MRKQGKVVFTKPEHGYFFVLGGDGIRRFSHVSQWGDVGMPNIGDYVTFELVASRKAGMPDECMRVLPAKSPGVEALAAKQTVQIVDGVQVLRTVVGA